MILYILYRIAQFLVITLPLKIAYRLGTSIADLQFLISKKDRALLINNLKSACNKSEEESRHSARAILRNFAKYLVEFLRFARMGRDYIQKNVKIEGLDNLKKALELKKGAIVFSAHLGNWEWGAAILAQLGFPVNVIALAHKDRNVNNFFINQRAIKGVKNIPLGGSVRKSLKLLSKNEIIGILSDRDFSNNSVPVNFFGKTALMPIGIGVLAIMSGSPLIPVFIVREKGNTYKYLIGDPIEYTISGNKENDIKEIVQKSIKSTEKYIRLYPEQWFMFDDPWKSKKVNPCGVK
ncbi:MAG: lysophospholipid acyltransferase family protein [Candidatus Omnitrophica bacterium]|nr:lysophospholipid acyltransferase family protein [Candidatus Omnitrophota bacterium]